MTFKDILRFITYSASSLISYSVDYGVFILCTKVIWNDLSVSLSTLLATITARIISSLCNYFLHRQIFKSGKSKYHHSFGKFVISTTFFMLFSWLLINTLYNSLSINTSILKPLVDSFIFILNFFSQKFWVFHPRKHESPKSEDKAGEEESKKK
ncbi:MAG: GtrA family protein [Treponemataceae bacterium]|nr:GtrA family protein [Treponemataceae bacterium]